MESITTTKRRKTSNLVYSCMTKSTCTKTTFLVWTQWMWHSSKTQFSASKHLWNHWSHWQRKYHSETASTRRWCSWLPEAWTWRSWWTATYSFPRSGGRRTSTAQTRPRLSCPTTMTSKTLSLKILRTCSVISARRSLRGEQARQVTSERKSPRPKRSRKDVSNAGRVARRFRTSSKSCCRRRKTESTKKRSKWNTNSSTWKKSKELPKSQSLRHSRIQQTSICLSKRQFNSSSTTNGTHIRSHSSKRSFWPIRSTCLFSIWTAKSCIIKPNRTERESNLLGFGSGKAFAS